MSAYDPEAAPDPQAWLDLDDIERISMIEEYHRRARIKVPNATLHATFHNIVENQLAEGFKPTVETMERLLNEGLSRHEALHAIGSVVIRHVYDLLKGNRPLDPEIQQARYETDLRALNAEQWLKQGPR